MQRGGVLQGRNEASEQGHQGRFTSFLFSPLPHPPSPSLILLTSFSLLSRLTPSNTPHIYTHLFHIPTSTHDLCKRKHMKPLWANRLCHRGDEQQRPGSTPFGFDIHLYIVGSSLLPASKGNSDAEMAGF